MISSIQLVIMVIAVDSFNSDVFSSPSSKSLVAFDSFNPQRFSINCPALPLFLIISSLFKLENNFSKGILTDCLQIGYASYNFIEILLSIHDY